MVTLEEIIERTFYISLLHETLKLGLTINPDDYLVDGKPTEELYNQYLLDKKAIGESFIYIFGIGNNQNRGIKDCPRITVELNAYYPGSIGMENHLLEKDDDTSMFYNMKHDYVAKSTQLDIHLVANTQKEMRLLHTIMYKALPAVGYLKPYLNDYDEWKSESLKPTGNIFIEVGNFYDHSDVSHGLLEKVYTYEISDGLIMEEIDKDLVISPIKDISVLIQPENTDGVELNIP